MEKRLKYSLIALASLIGVERLIESYNTYINDVVNKAPVVEVKYIIPEKGFRQFFDNENVLFKSDFMYSAYRKKIEQLNPELYTNSLESILLPDPDKNGKILF